MNPKPFRGGSRILVAQDVLQSPDHDVGGHRDAGDLILNSLGYKTAAVSRGSQGFGKRQGKYTQE